MACPTCSYQSNCSKCYTVSYTPSFNSHGHPDGPKILSYSHSETYSAGNIPAVHYTGSNVVHGAYVGASANDLYSNTSLQLNYKVSALVNDLLAKADAGSKFDAASRAEQDTENLPAVRPDNAVIVNAVPISNELQTTNSSNIMTPEEMQLMQALYRQLMGKIGETEGGLIGNLPEIPEGAVRVAQMEEETIVLQRKRIRVTDIIPKEKNMKDANPDRYE